MNKLLKKYKNQKRAAHLENLRKSCIPHAHGSVLEFCSGLGVNFDYYKYESIDSVTVVDKNGARLDFSKQIVKPGLLEKFIFVEDEVTSFLSAKNAEEYDSVVLPLCLCVFDNPSEIVEKSVALLRHDGSIISFQHGFSKYKIIARIQKVLDSLYKRSYGCHLAGSYDEIFQNMNSLAKVQSYRKYSGIFHVSIYKKV